MDNEQYMAMQVLLTALAAVVRDIDLEGFIERISHTESVAPIIDPSLWIKAGSRLEEVKKIALAARDFQKVVIETMEGEKMLNEKVILVRDHRLETIVSQYYPTIWYGFRVNQKSFVGNVILKCLKLMRHCNFIANWVESDCDGPVFRIIEVDNQSVISKANDIQKNTLTPREYFIGQDLYLSSDDETKKDDGGNEK